MKPKIGGFVSLEKLKRYPSMKQKWLGLKVRIWSGEWRMWWRPEGNGYTEIEADAWITRFENAWDNASHAGPEKQIEFQYAE